jgi:AcrR family transcriptional regulator
MEPARTPTPAPLHWVKPPQQARSQKTLARLLDAAEEVIKEQGMAALTVSEVARRAGSSVGAFYARFADKEGLLATLHERSCGETLATARLALDPERWDSLDITTMVEELVAFCAALCEERIGLVLAFLSLAATDVSYARRRSSVESAIGDLLGRLLYARRDELSHPDPLLAAQVAVRMVLNTLEYDAVTRRHAATEAGKCDPAFARELTRAVVAFIGAPTSGGRRAPAER